MIPNNFNTPIRTFASGYNWREKIEFIKNRVRPSHRYHNLTQALPKHAVINEGVTPQLRLALLGDVMPIKDFRLQIAPDVLELLHPADYYVINMEGIITDKKRMLALSHRRDIVAYLAQYFPPEKTIIYCANNHTGDFGYSVFMEQYQWLKDQFFAVIGAHDDAQVRIGNVNIASVTDLSNQVCNYVAWLKNAAQYHDPTADFNLLLPHWGYEMQLYPHPAQIRKAKQLLESWNLLAGNHSHCPQPATAYAMLNERRAVVYSMGNFCYHHPWPNHRYGSITHLTIGPNAAGKWQTGELRWAYTRHEHRNNGEMLVHCVEKHKL